MPNALVTLAQTTSTIQTALNKQSTVEYPAGTSGTVTNDIPAGITVTVLAGRTLTVWGSTIGSGGSNGTLVNNGTVVYQTYRA